MRHFTIVVTAVLLVSGCTVPMKEIALTSPFDAEAAREMLEAGANTISGSALIRQRGGGVVTCAGNDVYLVPVTAYSSERISSIYGSTEKGYSRGRITFKPDYPEYYALRRKTIGDPQGAFEFDKVADGEFFVTTNVTWMVGSAYQGGYLMQRVTVSGGETKKIVLTP